MATDTEHDGERFVPDENEPEVARELDNAMANIARALNSLHKLGVPQDLALMLVERRAQLRWQCNIDKDGVPTLSRLLEDLIERKIRGSSSAAKSSRVQASKFKGKIKRINTDPKAKAIMWPPSDAPPDAPRSYIDLLFDALECGVSAKRGEQTADNAPTVAPTAGDAAPTAGDAALGALLRSLPPLR